MSLIKILICLSITALSFFTNAEDNYISALAYDDVVRFIDEYSKTNKYKKEELIELFARTKIKKSIVKSSKNQPEKKMTWQTYKSKVVTEQKIKQGNIFLSNNIKILTKAEKEFGVPKEIIVSIIGIESFYGKYKGNNNAIDAISTMAFEGGKKRREFFTKELKFFLDHCYNNNKNPLSIKSSWAGAFGFPQFISSSITSYGLDYDKDGSVDLNNSIVDSIGSVANYLRKNKWIKNNYISERVEYFGKTNISTKGLRLNSTVGELEKLGVRFKRNMRKTKPAKLFTLNNNSETLYYVGYNNFKSITMYNRSNLYAMAVFELASQIAKKEVI